MRPSRHRISFTVRNWLTPRPRKNPNRRDSSPSYSERRKEAPLFPVAVGLFPPSLLPHELPTIFTTESVYRWKKGSQPERVFTWNWTSTSGTWSNTRGKREIFQDRRGEGGGTTFLFPACLFAFVDVPLSLRISPKPFFSSSYTTLYFLFFLPSFLLSLSLSLEFTRKRFTYLPMNVMAQAMDGNNGKEEVFFLRERERERGSKKFVIYEKAWLWRKNNVKGQPSVVKRLLQSKGFFTPGSGFALLLTFKEGGEGDSFNCDSVMRLRFTHRFLRVENVFNYSCYAYPRL